VKFWEPAAIDVSSMNRIVVLEFQGEHGKSVATALSGQLWQNEFYTVVDRTALSRDLQLASYTTDNLNENSLHALLSPARAQGIDGVVLGEILEYRCEDKRVRRLAANTSTGEGPSGSRNANHPGGAGGEFRENLVREGIVTIAFRLVDVETGEIRAADKVSHTYAGDQEGTSGKLPTREEVLAQLTEQCLAEIVDMMAPHEATSQIQLATCDIWTRGRREVKEGNRLAVEGDWKQAEQQWQAATRIEPENHAALFNLAIAADHRHEYVVAEEFAMQALRLQHKTCYTTGLDKIRAHRNAAEKTEEQRDARVVTAADEGWQ